MTKEEFFEKYGDVTVKFSSYCKYTFYYTAELPDGSNITCDVGGSAEDIYRYQVNADDEMTINWLEPFSGVVTKDGNEIESFYDY